MSLPEYYLGIHIGHDCNVTAMDQEGNILFAAGEERFNRVKMTAGFPGQSLHHVLDTFGNSVSHLSTARMRMKQKIFRELGFLVSSMAYGRAAPRFSTWLKNGIQKLVAGRTLETEVDRTGVDPEWPVVNVEHHRAHAAGAFYHSGFSKSYTVTLDGEGDGYSCCFYRTGKTTGIEQIRGYYHNEVTIGRDYEKVTAMLGFHPLRHPGKVTGLAAYGEKNDSCIECLKNYLESAWKKSRHKVLDSSEAYQIITEAGVEMLRDHRATLFKDFTREDLAFAIQWLSERKIEELIRKNIPDIQNSNICLAGGVFANVAINRRVKELGFKNVFIMPAMTDCGLSLGACMHSHPLRNSIEPAETMYLGNGFSVETIESELNRLSVAYTRPANLAKEAAEMLASGKVLARFDGRMEYGPRALGNRSILYHCGDASVNDWLNKQLNRTEFMPFAPVTLEEYAADRYLGYEGCQRTSKFMTITFECSELMKEEAPAVVHVDGTARPQVISHKNNPAYYELIDAYRQLTGIPTVVNTSFNMHEEPIVRTPEQAIAAFEASHLDGLIAGPFLIRRK